MLVVLIVALAGVLLWLMLAPARQVDPPHLDEETLDAEREVKELDAFTAPEDADDELPDWGPGAPKGRR